MNMKSLRTLSLFFLLSGLIFSGCKKEDDDDLQPVVGCTDSAADNFNPNATKDGGNCIYQRRFASQYDIAVACNQASDLFSDASLEIKTSSNKNKVDFYITSSSTEIQFTGTIINKDTVVVDTLIPNFSADLINLVPLATESKIVTVDLGIKTRLGLTKDIKNLNGLIQLKLISKDTVEYQGLKIPPITIDDDCDLKATKK